MHKNDFLASIGNTPLIKLRAVSEMTSCTILGKAEFMNPGGSVKDRAALAIIEDAENRGLLGPGGMIVEGTAGNTGIGLTMVGNAKGYKSVIVMPETQSDEKKQYLRIYGADLRLVPAVPYKNPDNYVRYSERLAQELSGAHNGGVIWANQFDNTANLDGHYKTTGPEIWEQTDHEVDGFICSVGSGGTLAGVGQFLKEMNPNIKIGLADPEGSALYNFYAHGELKAEGNSISEGIGQGRITANLEKAFVDMPFCLSDKDALPFIYALMRDEGLYLGGSSAINVAGAVAMAREMGPGHTIVTILCDSGQRYQSKVWNPEFLREKQLPVPDWL
ncbi:cysteine synthase A [Candidatus Puniceispirillum sp.]|uniref:cysteine synthase A n=1 Tax=Candidatus Puniceispirillum sp. TaxID=2026719 RepID=UPI001EC82E9C|nr:cysteine synthase A [Candidatus Puniceispirillum sp.]